MNQKPEVAPRKEKRAFTVWLAAFALVLIAAVFVTAHVLKTQHAPVATQAAKAQ